MTEKSYITNLFFGVTEPTAFGEGGSGHALCGGTHR